MDEIYATDAPPKRRFYVRTARVRAPKTPPAPTKVYLLVHENDRMFKIGVSDEPMRRSRSLPQARRINWTRSRHVDLPSRDRAFEVEGALHKSLKPYSAKVFYGDGRTEWFRIEAFPLALSLLHTIPKDGSGFSRMSVEDFAHGPNWEVRANVQRVQNAIALWRGVREHLRVTVREQEVLTFHRLRGVDANKWWRHALVDLDTYQLVDPGTEKPPHLVRLIAYDEQFPNDLVLSLTPLIRLKRLPGGAHIAANLASGLLDLMLE